MRRHAYFAASLALAALLGAIATVQADNRYRWLDGDGAWRFTQEPPGHGIPFEEIRIPDDIRWHRPAPMPPPASADEGELASGKLFKQVSGSIVAIVVEERGQRLQSGSGVAISDEEVLTNCHVVMATEQSQPVLVEGDKRVDGTIVARDFDHDRCVVSFRRARLSPVTALRLADDLEEGETVFAIGNPKGLNRSISSGLLSGKRELVDGEIWLQFTAPISAGSSGGGLFDSHGNLIGITNATRRDAQNINWAIPAATWWR